MASPIRLNLLPYLQSWDGSRLELRLLLVPRGSPLDPLQEGLTPPAPSFAAAKLRFDVRLVRGLTAFATTAATSASVVVTPAPSPQARTLFEEISRQYPIDVAPPPANPRPAGTHIRKYLPPSYRTAVGFSGARTPFAVTDESYSCAIQAPPTKPFRTRPTIPPKIPWGKVIALALRQPVLAEALGLVRPLAVPAPTTDFFHEGGWVYVTLAPTSDGFALTAKPGALKLYAARVPPLSGPRVLFTPVLFPVEAVPPSVSYDELFQESADYDDGFAKIVHAGQPRFLDPLREKTDGTRPLKELGLRIGWDDEQVVIWLNRQIDAAAAPLDSPMGVFGYRVDVREEGSGGSWSSLCRARGPLKVGPLTVGSFDGELGVEAAPVQLEGRKVGTYWLPMYYTRWTGPSLVAFDTFTHHLAGGPDLSSDPDRMHGVAPAVPLRYGKTYELRVRLMDHTGGGPAVDDTPRNPAPHPTFTVPFRRWIRPRAVRILDELPAVPDPSASPAKIRLRRPLVGNPEYLFTGTADGAARLLADLPDAKAEGREVGLPDPDVESVHVTAQVEALGFDGGAVSGYRTLYQTNRPFPTSAAEPLTLDLDWRDVKDASSLAPPSSGPLPLPTARNVRLIFRALAREDPGLEYFGAEDVRLGPLVSVQLRRRSSNERELFRQDTPGNRIKAIFLQPEAPVDAATAWAQRAAGKGQAAPDHAIGRLAEVLGLECAGLTLRARPGRRVVFGCSATLRHVLAPDASSIAFSSTTDLVQQWVVGIRLTLDRDWSWDGLAATGVAVTRGGVGEIGRLEPRRSLNEDALVDAKRDHTDLVYFDAIDPKPEPGQFPAELHLEYRLHPKFLSPPANADDPVMLSLRLPITTAPSQVPRMVSAGIALSPYRRPPDYSRTEPRRRALWIELDRPPDDPANTYFARVLCYAPDPLLLRGTELPVRPVPPLPIDPEPIRVVVPGQSDDQAGLGAMQPLISSDSPRHFLIPLPPGVHEESPELFGFFTYELRVGHATGWSTAQGRFGAPLRVTGVQHPCPQLECLLVRDRLGLKASAAVANPVYEGRSLRPSPPATQIWMLLYAQVVQADGADTRNVLLDHRRARHEVHSPHDLPLVNPVHALATWSHDEIVARLEALTLDPHTRLSCLAVETLPGETARPDPLGADLGFERILRTSPLTAVPGIC